MANHKDKFFVGKIEEVIKDDQNVPTLGLRVRIPTLHGRADRGVPTEDLPIAKPLVFPGAMMDLTAFESIVSTVDVVYVIFEGGEVDRPLYFGLRGSVDDATIAQALEIGYATETNAGLIRVKKVGNTGYIYTSDNN